MRCRPVSGGQPRLPIFASRRPLETELNASSEDETPEDVVGELLVLSGLSVEWEVSARAQWKEEPKGI
jgi:hypothetical protein